MSGVGQSLREFRKGTLRSGSGKLVTSRKQAVAIGLAQERREQGITAEDAARALVLKGEKL